MADSITVRAPSSTANLGPGFDVFGLALDAFHDTVSLSRARDGIVLSSSDGTPAAISQNTAGIVVKAIMRKFGVDSGVKISIKKGVPAGFGVGSSAASAAAAAVATDKLFGLGMNNEDLVRFAGMGERASAGSVHYDNVAASLLGGFVIVNTNPLKIIHIRPPSNLFLCVAIPEINVPKKKTMVSRSVIPDRVKLGDATANLANASMMVAGFLKKDTCLVGMSIRDVIVEPARKHMIPGFDRVKKRALAAGALGFTISGAGPSVIAFCDSRSAADMVSVAICAGFKAVGTSAHAVVCRPGRGAYVR